MYIYIYTHNDIYIMLDKKRRHPDGDWGLGSRLNLGRDGVAA